MPSKHISDFEHLQVKSEESEALARVFDAKSRKFIRHGAAHILPASRNFVNAVQNFLESHMHSYDG